ncbi:phosphoglycolate phosphatase/pyrophosphatase PpaX [Cytobacillus purgationiresistens]|uniref:Phosphoglycolate phosphatase/pyrophosphatase PpaX n=1 Tax=Cytobacillus purgationiresistens TaxID=863449 RepID=A0ABU0AJC2_9BACI|nr:phosphoglycolate phosphatase/pyrophosphatase PpaX [Cytobacillus purgationiresistens]
MIDIRAVLFDFDGTLANTLPLCIHAFQVVFNTFDKCDLSAEKVKAMFGPSETGIIRKNLKHEEKEQAIELYYTIYENKHHQFVHVNHEIDGLISFLKEHGVKLGIVTGKARRSLDISLKVLGMEGKFDVIITGDDVIKPKPDPEGIFTALQRLGEEPEDSIFLGDSDADIMAGLKANIYTAGVHWLPDGQTKEFSIIPDSAFLTVDEFWDFLKLGVLNER